MNEYIDVTGVVTFAPDQKVTIAKIVFNFSNESWGDLGDVLGIAAEKSSGKDELCRELSRLVQHYADVHLAPIKTDVLCACSFSGFGVEVIATLVSSGIGYGIYQIIKDYDKLRKNIPLMIEDIKKSKDKIREIVKNTLRNHVDNIYDEASDAGHGETFLDEKIFPVPSERESQNIVNTIKELQDKLDECRRILDESQIQKELKGSEVGSIVKHFGDDALPRVDAQEIDWCELSEEIEKPAKEENVKPNQEAPKLKL